jgi:hypothetical protein
MTKSLLLLAVVLLFLLICSVIIEATRVSIEIEVGKHANHKKHSTHNTAHSNRNRSAKKAKESSAENALSSAATHSFASAAGDVINQSSVLEEIRSDHHLMKKLSEMFLELQGGGALASLEGSESELDAAVGEKSIETFNMELPELYDMYCKKFRKQIKKAERNQRLEAFIRNLVNIAKHNKNNSTISLLAPSFSMDMTREEFTSTHANLIVPLHRRNRWKDPEPQKAADKDAADLASAESDDSFDENDSNNYPDNEEGSYSPENYGEGIAISGSGSYYGDEEEQPYFDSSADDSGDDSGNDFGNDSGSNSVEDIQSDPNIDPAAVTTNPSKNWVLEGKVSPIRNQQNCGACYSFSAVTALESTLAIVRKTEVIPFSVQQSVDCSSSYGNVQCTGGPLKPTIYISPVSCARQRYDF